MDRLSCEDVEKALVALTLNPKELSAAQRAEILAQVDGCEGCRELYEDYVRVSAGLLHAVPARVPPPALKASLMARAQASLQPLQTAPPQQIPAPARQVAQAPSQTPTQTSSRTPQRGFLGRLWDWLTGSARTPRMAFGLAAVLIATAAGVLTTRLSSQLTLQNVQMTEQQRTLTEQQTQLAQQQKQILEQQQLLAVLSDPGTHAVSLKALPAAPNASAKLQFNPTGTTAVLSLDGMPALEASQQYQLWLFDAAGKPLPSNAFDATAKNVVINAEAKFGGYINFAVSVEPKGGSITPTGPLALIANS